MSASPFFTLLCTPWGKGGGTADGVGHNDYISLVSVMVMMIVIVMVMSQCGLTCNWTGQGGAQYERGVDGKGGCSNSLRFPLHCHVIAKVGDIRIPRAVMNKLVMNYLVTEGFKVGKTVSACKQLFIFLF